MQLTDDQIEAIRQKVLPDTTTCANCGGSSYEAARSVFQLVPLDTPEWPPSVAGPVVTVMCLGCHHVRLFSATGLGLVDKIDSPARQTRS